MTLNISLNSFFDWRCEEKGNTAFLWKQGKIKESTYQYSIGFNRSYCNGERVILPFNNPANS